MPSSTLLSSLSLDPFAGTPEPLVYADGYLHLHRCGCHARVQVGCRGHGHRIAPRGLGLGIAHDAEHVGERQYAPLGGLGLDLGQGALVPAALGPPPAGLLAAPAVGSWVAGELVSTYLSHPFGARERPCGSTGAELGICRPREAAGRCPERVAVLCAWLSWRFCGCSWLGGWLTPADPPPLPMAPPCGRGARATFPV